MALPLNYTLNKRDDLTTAIPPVDPAGDVNLCTRRTQFLVSSKALALGSKVFHAMFLPRFEEGVQLQEHIERKDITGYRQCRCLGITSHGGLDLWQ